MAETLLFTVQRVLDKLNLDPINSINDTEDALLVAKEAETTYYDLLTRGEWPYQEDIITVESVSDVNNPTALRIPDNVEDIKSLQYDVTTVDDVSKKYRRIKYLEPQDFLEKVYSRNTDSVDVDIANAFGTEIFIFNNRMPTYYTTFDDEHLILDSHDKSESQTLLGSRTVCIAITIPTWLIDDTFVIPLNKKFYPLYLASLASACSISLLNTINSEEERRQQRAISRLRQNAARTELQNFPRFNFGRVGNGLS